MSELEQRQRDFINSLAEFTEWNDKFNYIIELGTSLPPLPGHLKTPDNMITHCKSITYTVKTGGKVYGDSNSVVVRGLIAVVRQIFDSISAEPTDTINFHTESGLLENLTLLRREGLLKMIKRAKI
jgi:cysteine desulfuration protein SufE